MLKKESIVRQIQRSTDCYLQKSGRPTRAWHRSIQYLHQSHVKCRLILALWKCVEKFCRSIKACNNSVSFVLQADCIFLLLYSSICFQRVSLHQFRHITPWSGKRINILLLTFGWLKILKKVVNIGKWCSVYGRGRKLDKATKMFNTARDLGLSLDEKAYMNLISYFGKAGIILCFMHGRVFYSSRLYCWY